MTIEKLYGEQHFTQPPPRYSEASLVKALEQYGIGRPSTYASIISTLQNREYVLLDKKRFTPTDVGRVVNKFLTEHFAHWVDYEFTAKLEDELDDISNGKEEWMPVLRALLEGFLGADRREGIGVAQGRDAGSRWTRPAPSAATTSSPSASAGAGASSAAPATRSATTRATSTAPRAAEAVKRELGTDPESGKLIQLLQGPFGPYIQLGEMEGDKKPKRVSVPKNIAARRTSTSRSALQAARAAARPRARTPRAARRWSPRSGASVPT